MKYMKAASAIAISMIAAGAVSPAMAADRLGDAVVESVPRTATKAAQHLNEGDSKKLVLEGAEGAMDATQGLGGLPIGS
ncbi:hypothetical protein [Streptomyces enissocaesilis]|uniref:Secreted protein n=1 Tax=Streptomyces enissocaesilis TaxID=332589 RepID=A0ABN3WPJ0_9ACTN